VLVETLTFRAIPVPGKHVSANHLQIKPTGYQIKPTGYQIKPTGYQIKPTEYQIKPTEYQIKPTYLGGNLYVQ